MLGLSSQKNGYSKTEVTERAEKISRIISALEMGVLPNGEAINQFEMIMSEQIKRESAGFSIEETNNYFHELEMYIRNY